MSQHYLLQDGQLTPTDALIQNRALSYGDGFFSTLGVVHGQILWSDGHATRLITGATVFELDIDTPFIMAQLATLAQCLEQGIIKIIIARQAQNLQGYGYHNGQAEIYIKTSASSLYVNTKFIHGIPIQPTMHAIALGELLGMRSPRFSGIKLISCHEQVFAHTALLHAQRERPMLAEALIKNILGQYIGGTMSNVFYRLGTDWHTPPMTHSGVNGVMRQVILAKNPTISERTLNTDDLSHLSALCFTNAVRGIIPIDILWYDGQYLQLDANAYRTLVCR